MQLAPVANVGRPSGTAVLTSMTVLLAGAYPRDSRQGSPRVLLRLYDELRSREHEDYRTGLSAAGTRPKWARALLFRILRLPMVASWARHADAVLVGSAPVRNYAVKRGWKPPEQILVVPCGVDQRYLAADGSE